MLLQVILEGLGLGILLVLVCAVGIRKGAVGMVHLYSPAVQQRCVKLGLTTHEKIKRNSLLFKAVCVPGYISYVLVCVYGINGARSFAAGFCQLLFPIPRKDRGQQDENADREDRIWRESMKHLHFDVELNGFYGAYWACVGGSDCAVITMIGDDPEDRLARSAVKWLCGCGVNVLTMSPAKKDYGHHNYPLERVETAISWLKANGNRKTGIAGASTTGTLALTAAAMFPDITLTIAMTPSDFVWQGFLQGKRDGCKEWPVEGESLFSYRGKPLPYMPFCYQHPDYWHCIAAESKRVGDMVNSRKLFDDSETAHPIEPEEYIPVENIRGKLLLIGAEDDALWDTAKYIRRMEKRLAEKPHECEIETMVYAHGTHFVFPEGMLKIMLPVGSGLFVKFAFQAAKKYPKECRQTRIDIEKRMCRVLAEWKGAK